MSLPCLNCARGSLKDSPLLSTERAKELFPTKAERDELEKLAAALDTAIAKNQSAAKTWDSLGKAKRAALKLVGEALGRAVPGL